MWKATVVLSEITDTKLENFAKETKSWSLCDSRVGPLSTQKKKVANSSIGG
jgi:hypothetical protein